MMKGLSMLMNGIISGSMGQMGEVNDWIVDWRSIQCD
jgi:hypothetical protein